MAPRSISQRLIEPLADDPRRIPRMRAHPKCTSVDFHEPLLDSGKSRVQIPIGERHFRRAVTEYIEHYHGERNHQGLDNRLISGAPVIEMTSRVRRRPWLGGLLNFYERAA